MISSLIHQILSGMLIALHYTSDISHSYSSVMHIIQDISYGWYFHYLHSIGASIILVVMYLHIGRSLYIGSFLENANLWLSGLCTMIFLMLISFLGYVLINGMMSMMSSKKGLNGPINLGNPVEFKIKELAMMIIKLTNSKSKIINKELPIDDPIRRRPDISKAKKELDWEPKIDVMDGLKETIEYFKKKI